MRSTPPLFASLMILGAGCHAEPSTTQTLVAALAITALACSGRAPNDARAIAPPPVVPASAAPIRTEAAPFEEPCDRSGWCTQTPSPPSTGLSEPNRALWAVAVGGADTAYAVGTSGRILRNDGRGWVEERSPTTEELSAVWAGAEGQAAAVGRNGVVLQRDQRGQWSSRPAVRGRTTAHLTSVWSDGDASLYVTSHDWLYRFEGGKWSAVAGEDDSYWQPSIAGGHQRAGELTVVWMDLRQREHRVERLEGSRRRVLATFSGGYFGGAWAAPDGQVFVAGTGALYHFDGARVAQHDIDVGLVGVWGRSSSDVYAVGQGAILHFDGAKLRDEVRGDFHASSIAGSERDAFAVGRQQGILHKRLPRR